MSENKIISKEETTLFDFCNFLEKELKITLTNEQWKIYYEQKKVSLKSEENDIMIF